MLPGGERARAPDEREGGQRERSWNAARVSAADPAEREGIRTHHVTRFSSSRIQNYACNHARNKKVIPMCNLLGCRTGM